MYTPTILTFDFGLSTLAGMPASAMPVATTAVVSLRVLYRREMASQIVHDSITRRPGWAETYALHVGGERAGFATVAIGGPWTGQPTILELYLLPAQRGRAFEAFEALLTASGARQMEIQSNNALLAVMLHTYARDVWSEKIVFQDAITTQLTAGGTTLEPLTPDAEVRAALAQRQGGTEWRLRLGDDVVATGGILFHYNEPFGDIYMEVGEPFRQRGFGAYLVQELKRIAYELGSVPAARCSPSNVPSRRTLQKAGLVPFAHILKGTVAAP